VVQLMMNDPVTYEPGHEGPRGRRRVHLVTGVAKGAELRPEQELEADIGGGDVQEARHVMPPPC
jgi:hypothetical protein